MNQLDAEMLPVGSKVEHNQLGECKVKQIMPDMDIVIEPLTQAGLKLLEYWTDTDITSFLEDEYSQLKPL